MQSDKHSMAEKILYAIESVVNRDDIEEFIIIPVTLNQNKSPVVYVERNLGLESWCIKHTYSYAYQKTLEARKLISKRKLLNEDYSNINRYTLGTLLINPDVATFWNIRRELVLEDLLQTSHELKIAKLVLSHKSKSNEAFAYRRWLLQRLVEMKTIDKAASFALLNEEFSVCNIASQKSPNNYHAWNHRIWCLEFLLPRFSKDVCTSILHSELNYTETWISKHVSEYSGFHYRQYVVDRVVNSPDVALGTNYKQNFGSEDIQSYFRTHSLPTNNLQLHRTFILHSYELALNTELQHTFKEHEALWYHRRRILHNLFTIIATYFGRTISKATNYAFELSNCEENQIMSRHKLSKMLKCSETNDAMHSSPLYKHLVENEKVFLKGFSFKNEDVNSWAVCLVKRHEKWLTHLFTLLLDV